MALLKKNPLISFFVLTFLISWLIWLPLWSSGEDTSGILAVFLLLGGLGPLFAAILVSAITGTMPEFKERVFKWKTGFRWYLGALLIPIAIYLVAYLLYLILGGTPMDFSSADPVIIYPLALLFVIFLGGGLEEPGWRGFALPRLQEKFSPLTSSIMLGLLWAFWHFPLFFSAASAQSELPLGWYIPNAVALSIIFTWLFNKSGGSALLAIILHGGVNAPSGWYPLGTTVETAMGPISSYAPITITSWIVVVVIIVFSGLRKKRG